MKNMTTPVLPIASFFCQENASDKEYHMQVAAVADGFVVKYQYGRRGATLTPGIKPAQPIPFDKAVKQFDSMCKERIIKGYTLADNSTVTTTAIEIISRTKSSLMPQLLNAIDESALTDLLQNTTMCMQEKEDGERVMVSRKNTVVTASNKLGFTRPLPQAVVEAILALPCREVILDGELVSNQYRVFDMLSLDDACQRQVSYLGRYAAYSDFLHDVDSSAISIVKARFSPAEKSAHFELIRSNKGEGVVFKNIYAHYAAGRPNSGGPQLKYKFTESATCIVNRVSHTRRCSFAC